MSTYGDRPQRQADQPERLPSPIRIAAELAADPGLEAAATAIGLGARRSVVRLAARVPIGHVRGR